MGHSAEPVSELVLDPAETGVQQGGVGQDQGEQQTPDLMEAVLDAHEVLGEVLNNFEQSASHLLLLKQFSPQRFDLRPVEEPHCGGGHGHG